jgi:hypothetical protein
VNRHFEIELFEEYEAVNFYTIRFKGEDSEFDKFLDKFPKGCTYEKDINIILKWYQKISEVGALERYFNTREGRIYDRLVAIPIETSKLRLYCLRISDRILILGNGGIKKTKTYNVDPELNAFVETLQILDNFLNYRIKKGQIRIDKNDLIGNIKFSKKESNEKE